MWGYRSAEVAKLLGLSVAQVRACVRDGFVGARHGPRGELRFSFQDLVVLRAASALLQARVPARRVRRALKKLRQQLPAGTPLAGVHVSAQGDQIVVRQGDVLWQAESGQALFDFDVDELARDVAPLLKKKSRADSLSARDWYEWAYDLEDASVESAIDAYKKALSLDPTLGDAHLNLGRLLHAKREVAAALQHYQRAAALSPEDATAWFNYGVALEDNDAIAQAVAAYEHALEQDPSFADAHFNLARLFEKAGNRLAALRHFGAFRRLTPRGG